MKHFFGLLATILFSISFTSCQSTSLEPEGDPADSTKIPTDTIDLTLDSLKTGLIAFYPFDGNAKDLSGNKHNGLVYNITDAKNRFNKSASAYEFNGYSAFVRVEDAEDLRLYNTSFTVNYWIYVDAYNLSHGSAILHKRGSGSSNGWHLSFSGAEAQHTSVGKVGRPTYGVSAGDDPFAVGEKYLQKGIWYMITAVYDLDAQTYTTYINGKLDAVAQNIPTPNALTDAPLFIGRDSIFPYDGTEPYYFMGRLDDIRIYNRIISDTEMQKLFVLTPEQSAKLSQQ